MGSNFEAVDLTPIVASLDQPSGTSGGGTAVTVHGRNFSGAAGQLQVYFGTTLATQVTIVSDSVLFATTPAHAAGTVDVSVHTPYGVSATSASDRFTFTAAGNPPVVDLNGGISGAGFTANWFDSGAVPITDMADATITASTANLASLTVTLGSFHTGDVLAVPILSGVTGLTASYTNGTLSLTGNQTVANYQKELRLINYSNTAGGPGVGSLTANVTLSDGTLSSNPAVATISVTVPSGQVRGERLFYNNSVFDGASAAINSSDDLAIASDKIGFNGVGTASFANVSSFSGGITGIMVDLQSGLGNHAAINTTSGDITFKVSPAAYVAGSYNNVAAWSTAPPPAAISVRLGAGTGGSDRVEIVWNSGAIKNEWLEINLPHRRQHGPFLGQRLYFGSAIGDSGLGNTASVAVVNATDVSEVRGSLSPATQVTPAWNVTDFDRNGIVNASDSSVVVSNFGLLLHYIANLSGPFAPRSEAPMFALAPAKTIDAESVVGLSADNVVPTAATLNAQPGTSVAPAWLQSTLARAAASNRPAPRYFEPLAAG